MEPGACSAGSAPVLSRVLQRIGRQAADTAKVPACDCEKPTIRLTTTQLALYTHRCVKQREKRTAGGPGRHSLSTPPAPKIVHVVLWCHGLSRHVTSFRRAERPLGLGHRTVALGSSERCTLAGTACPGREPGAPRARLLASSGTNGDTAPARPSPSGRGSPALPPPNRARRVGPSPASGRRPSRRGPRRRRPSSRPHSPPECGAQERSG